MKFYGEVGYGISVEQAPGVYDDTIVERIYMGDVERLSRKLREGESVNDDLTVGNAINIVTDPYAIQNFSAIKYVRWQGGLWKVTDIDVRPPRLFLRLGGVYNGPKA